MPDSRGLLVTEGPFTTGRSRCRYRHPASVRQLAMDVPNAHQGSLSPDGRRVIFLVSENGFDGVPHQWNEELWPARRATAAA